MTLSTQRAARLKPLLDRFSDERDWAQRVARDPIEFPHRYRRPRDIEVAGLLATALAYGRVDLFKPKVGLLLERLGDAPAARLRGLSLAGAAQVVRGVTYRFNVEADFAALLLGVGAALRERGSLEALYLAQAGSSRERLAAFARAIVAGAPLADIRRRLGRERALHHLLPTGEGAQKRLNLYLRWMVRGPDTVDFGIWKQVSPASLTVPLDTHVARMGRLLGLTARRDLSWRTAEEISESLRRLDASDPVRYDFALCHYGMSGACPVRPVRDNCLKCPLRAECRVGRRLDL